MTPSPIQSAAQVRHLAAERDRLERELADTDAALRRHGRALCDAYGYRVMLRGPALLRLAGVA